MKRILVVEDDIMLNSGLCYNLELDKYRAVPAHNVTDTLEKMKGKVYDLVVLDVNLPDGSGFNLCKKIRAVQDVPIVFLTARDLEEDVMTGFELVQMITLLNPLTSISFVKKCLLF
ncbi:response regulator [Clostridium luticellarii]|uniref:response regulator n=1 Tax=Clostridium luticellarii TaxID=1691940 RepID=UPI00235748DE|nr:response regulator [Clostridium luticellarii]MCI1945418.1 response regulator [Clostridium luticellarii]